MFEENVINEKNERQKKDKMFQKRKYIFHNIEKQFGEKKIFS